MSKSKQYLSLRPYLGETVEVTGYFKDKCFSFDLGVLGKTRAFVLVRNAKIEANGTKLQNTIDKIWIRSDDQSFGNNLKVTNEYTFICKVIRYQSNVNGQTIYRYGLELV